MRIALLILVAACSQKPEAAEPAPEPAPAPEAQQPDPAETPPTKPSEDFEAKKELANQVVAMFDEVAAAVTANEADCAAMATAIDGIATNRADLIAKANSLQDDAELKEWLAKTHGEHVQQVMTGMMESMMKNCHDDEGVKNAFRKLEGGAGSS